MVALYRVCFACPDYQNPVCHFFLRFATWKAQRNPWSGRMPHCKVEKQEGNFSTSAIHSSRVHALQSPRICPRPRGLKCLQVPHDFSYIDILPHLYIWEHFGPELVSVFDRLLQSLEPAFLFSYTIAEYAYTVTILALRYSTVPAFALLV